MCGKTCEKSGNTQQRGGGGALICSIRHTSTARVRKCRNESVRMECVCAPCVRKEEGIVACRTERRGMRAVSGFERMKRANGRSGLAKRKMVPTGRNRSVNGGAKRKNAAASRKYARKTLCATSERRKSLGKGISPLGGKKTPNKRPKEHGVMESPKKAQNPPIALNFAKNYFTKHGKIKYFYKKLPIFDGRGGTLVVCGTFRLWTTH